MKGGVRTREEAENDDRHGGASRSPPPGGGRSEVSLSERIGRSARPRTAPPPPESLAPPPAGSSTIGNLTVDALRGLLAEGNAGITNRLDNVESRMEDFEHNLESDRQEHTRQLQDLTSQISDIRTRQETMSVAPSSVGSGTAPSLRSLDGFASVSQQTWPRPSQPARGPETTIVGIRGWDDDTKGDKVLDELTDMTRGIPHIVDRYPSGKRCKTGKLKFENGEKMWAWVQTMKGKKLKYGSRDFWFLVEKTDEEFAKSKMIGKGIRTLIEAGISKTVIDADYKQLRLWVNDIRIAIPDDSRTHLVAVQENWVAAGLADKLTPAQWQSGANAR